MYLKAGTLIELYGAPSLGALPERATIARWTRVSGPREAMPQWHIARFDDGGSLCVHETRFRVIDANSPVKTYAARSF